MSSRNRYQTFQRIRRHIDALAETYDLTLAVTDLAKGDDLVMTSAGMVPAFLAAARAMQDARPGLPGAQAYDAPSVSGGSSKSTQPERLAEQEDRTEADRRLLDTTLAHLWVLAGPGVILDAPVVVKGITADALTLRRLIEAWTPRPPTDKQRQAVTRANDPEAECAHHRTFGTFEPVHRTTDGSGLLNLPTPLCRFCYDRLRTDGVLPSADRMQRLAQGRSDRVRA